MDREEGGQAGRLINVRFSLQFANCADVEKHDNESLLHTLRYDAEMYHQTHSHIPEGKPNHPRNKSCDDTSDLPTRSTVKINDLNPTTFIFKE